MQVRLGLPSPRIATKLYGTDRSAPGDGLRARCRTRSSSPITRKQRSAACAPGPLAQLAPAARLQRAAGAASPAGGHCAVRCPESLERDESNLSRAQRRRSPTSSASVARRAGRQTHSQRFRAARLAGRLRLRPGARRLRDQAIAAAARYADAAERSRARALRRRRAASRSIEDALEGLASRARSLTSWVWLMAGITALLIGPLGFLLLRRVLVAPAGNRLGARSAWHATTSRSTSPTLPLRTSSASWRARWRCSRRARSSS